jgi:metallopeptidase MepB
MAKTPETVNNFLGSLRAQLAPHGITEIAHLKEIKAEDLKNRGLETSNDGHYYLWDHRFYDRMQIEKECLIDEQTIAEYFPLTSTIKGILHMLGNLLGFVFVELDKEARTELSGPSHFPHV